MATFRDTKEREWLIAINVYTLSKVKDALQVDLLEIVEAKGRPLIERLTADWMLLCNVLFVLCQEQAEKDSVSDDDFGRSMSGEVLDTGLEALLIELVNFSPKRKRKILQRAMSTAKRVAEQTEAEVEKLIGNGRMEALMQKEAEKLLQPLRSGELFGDSQESSESTPADGHSDSSTGQPTV